MTYGPNSIHHKIWFIRKNGISKQLADFFNLSLITGVFPSVLKTAKVVPAFKKNSKLYCNYRLIYLSSNIEKKNIKWFNCKKDCISLNSNNNNSNNNNDNNLQFGFRQQYSTFPALINMTENIRKALDDGNKSYGVFADF